MYKPEKKKIRHFIEPMASALALQCSTIWAMKTHILGAGQFVEFAFTGERNETWKTMWTAEVQILWRYDRRSGSCILGNNK